MTLKDIGFNRWLEGQLDEHQMAIHQLARVTSVHKDRYLLSNGKIEIFAELSGTLIYSTDSAADLPTVGDWVYADFYDEDSHAIIHAVLARQSLLKRKAAGKRIDFQLIAANIDFALIIQSVDFNFNLGRLERYLVMVNEAGITPIVLLSKSDLIENGELQELEASVREIAPEVKVIAFSNLRDDKIDMIKGVLLRGHTFCLLGSSGVGKTTLLNSILGSDHFETQSVSKKQNKGRHTTTSRELIQLPNGAMLIDTPGMRELGNLSVDTGIEETFAEILEFSQKCKFTNCSHTKEKGCAILSAIASGEISEQRYKSYLKLKEESAFYDMSYQEKRKKDKEFGKLIKSTLKGKSR